MLVNFFLHLKQHNIPVILRELLDLLNALDSDLVQNSINDFYQLSRLILIKEERYFDRFDLAFSSYLNEETTMDGLLNKSIPKDWLAKQLEKHFTDEQKQQIKSLGGFDELMKTFEQRLKEQKKRHQGGNKWIGTGGTSPFGAYGYNPDGIRIGQEGSRHQRAVKVWDKREYRNLDEDRMLEKRNMSVALRRLKKSKKQGALTEFDLQSTIQSTAKNAGFLDLQYKAEKQNDLKVLMFYDIGGSMDYHVELSQNLFVAAKSCFKSLEYFYFHNCPYEKVWRDNNRRQNSTMNTMTLLRQFDADYKVIFVGDASMSPYELLFAGGSVEHMNDEAGKVWLERIVTHFPSMVWLNPLEKSQWHAQSVEMIQDVITQRMYPLSVHGISEAIAQLIV